MGEGGERVWNCGCLVGLEGIDLFFLVLCDSIRVLE